MQRIQTAILQDLSDQQRRYINYFFDHIDLSQVEAVLQACMECKGLLIFTGVGKSGIIAEKIVMTLISTGSRALYLPAVNFLHGDIGGISSEDVVFMLSKSGETKELLNLIPHIQRKESKIVAVVSDAQSRLGKGADHTVWLPVEKELCIYDLAPTTSTVVQLLFGDLLAMALMKEKRFSLEEYASNHPAGSIGVKITLLVKDLMITGEDLPFCAPGDKLIDVISELSNKRCGCLLVVSEEEVLLGIFTDGDLRRALQEEGAFVLEKEIYHLMNPSPITVGPELLAHDALKKMQQKRYVTTAPVIENGKVIGLIRMHDIVQKGTEK